MLLSEVFTLYPQDEYIRIFDKDTNKLIMEGYIDEICSDKYKLDTLKKYILKDIQKVQSLNVGASTGTMFILR